MIPDCHLSWFYFQIILTLIEAVDNTTDVGEVRIFHRYN